MEKDSDLKESLIKESSRASQVLSSINLLASKIKSQFAVLSRDFSTSINLENTESLDKEYGQIKGLLQNIDTEIIELLELSNNSFLKESHENYDQKNMALLSVQNLLNSNLPSVSKLAAIKISKDNSVLLLIRKLNNLANVELDTEIHEEFHELQSDVKITGYSEKSHKSYLFATLSMGFLVVGYIVMAYIYYLSFLKDKVYFSENSESNQL